MYRTSIVCLALTLTLLPSSLVAADRFVGPGGSDSGDGRSLENRWRTFSYAVSRLQPGDVLRVQPGSYPLRKQGAKEGMAYVRHEGAPLDGDVDHWTVIRAERPDTVTIEGNLDVRGSFIRIEGLTIKGDAQNDEPGIAVYDSHHIDLIDNQISYCGGGGISTNRCDCLRIYRNRVHHNAYRNRDQHSGISIYQPIARPDPENRYWKIEIKRNFSWNNMNRQRGASGLTDGNGIIVDDCKYEQIERLKPEHRKLIGDLRAYPGRTLIEANVCGNNGGSGIHVYISLNVTIKNNTCIGNRRATYDSRGRYTNKGQISLSKTDNCQVINNVMQSRLVEPKGTAPVSPYAASDIEGSGNRWSSNLLHSTAPTRGALSNLSKIEAAAIAADPKFADIPNGDYRALAGKGQGEPWPRHVYIDFNGTTVPPDTAPDLGAVQVGKED